MFEGLSRRLPLLRRVLPVLLAFLTLSGLALEALFQHDQGRRLQQLRETGTLSLRLLAAAHESVARQPDATTASARVEALSAAGSVALALSQSFSGTGPASAWLSPAPSTAPLARQWTTVAERARALQDLAAEGHALRRRALALESGFIRMRVNSNDLLDELVASEAKPAQLRAAARQLALVERLAAGARALAGDRELLAWADRLGRDAVVFGDVLNALENGSTELKIPRVLNRDARDILAGLSREFRQIVPALEPVLDSTARRSDPGVSLDALDQALERAGQLSRETWLALEQRARDRFPRPVYLIWLALLTVLAIIAAMVAGLRERRRELARQTGVEEQATAHAAALEQSREALRQQLQHLAQSIAQVAEGQTGLRRQPGQGEDAVVTAAFSALERLADRMREHADQGLRLVRGGALLGDITRTLRDESRRQGEVMEQMGLATRDMAVGLDPLTRDGQEAGDAARGSSAQARQAGETVSGVVNELAALQGSAEECARRVQRLEEAAREMLTVRELTEDVSELGKLLSLNVAIQASVDSAASRALSSFSDEVQRLAERARSAMVRIDVVHRELRDEAQRAAGAINDSLVRARAAVTRAQGAGASLQALDQAAQRLEAIGERLERRQREHAHRVTAVVRSITALHQATGVLRQQVDVTVDSSTALVDAGAGFEQSLERRAGGQDQLLSVAAASAPEGATDGVWTPASLAERTPEPEPSGDEVTQVLEPR